MIGKPYTKATARSRTGIVGVGFSRFVSCGKLTSYFTANLGRKRTRRFNIDQLGRAEALRRAVRERADYEAGRRSIGGTS